MAKQPGLSNVAANAMADDLAVLQNNGFLRIYDGTKPATVDTAIATQVLLAELRWNATAFGAAVGGLIVANAITGDASANASGVASWFRSLKSDGTTAVWDGTVGTSNADCVVASTTIVAGQPFNITSAQIAVPKS